MNSVNIIKNSLPNKWSITGFYSANERSESKVWRSVIGKTAEVKFLISNSSNIQISYRYFTVVPNLIVKSSLDETTIQIHNNKDIMEDYGYTIKKLKPGYHVIRFDFSKTRESKTGDPRKIPIAFEDLTISEKTIPKGIWGNSKSAEIIAVIVFFLLIYLTLRALDFSNKAMPRISQNNSPK